MAEDDCGITGFSGHANYCAANAAVDAMAACRAAQGLPDTAVQWGAWSAVGAVCQEEQLQASLQATTLLAIRHLS